MWFDSWPEILRVLIIGSVPYAALVVVLVWAPALVPGARAAVTARPVVLIASGEIQHVQLRDAPKSGHP